MIAATKSERSGSIQARCVSRDRDAAGDHGHCAERVAEDVKERRADVHVAFARRAQRESDAGIDRKADGRDERHHAGVRLDGRGKAADRKVDDRERRDEQNRSVDQSAEHFDASVTKRAPRVGGSRSVDGGNQRERQRNDVHADVHGVAGQRQAARDGAAPELEHRDQRRRQERKTQTARNARRSHYGVLRAFSQRASSIAPNVTNVLLSAVRTTSARHSPCAPSIGVDRGITRGTRSQ